jgi:hypothetical protein
VVFYFSQVFGIALFYFIDHCVYLQIFMEHLVVYVPRCVQNGSESLGLKALEDFDVGIGDCPP